MKNEFVITNNVRRLYQLADILLSTGNGTPGMGLFYGSPGLGKSEAAIYMQTQKDYVYLRAKAAWTTRWFLNDLLHELNEEDQLHTQKAYIRLVEVLSIHPRLIIIDEVDHMLHNSTIIETLRDIHDESGNRFLLIGMNNAERKFKSYPHVYSRLADIVCAQPIGEEEILEISTKLSEIPMSQESAKRLFEVTLGEFRKIITWLHYLEQKAKDNSFDIIEPTLITKNKQ